MSQTTVCVSNWFKAARIYAVSWIGYTDGLVQNCSNSSALAMELLQFCTEPSTYNIKSMCDIRNNVNLLSTKTSVETNCCSEILFKNVNQRKKWIIHGTKHSEDNQLQGPNADMCRLSLLRMWGPQQLRFKANAYKKTLWSENDCSHTSCR